MIREAIARAHRVVVKVGSSSLTSSGRLDPERLDRLVDALAAQRAAGRQVVLVSSGAIAAVPSARFNAAVSTRSLSSVLVPWRLT